MSLLLINTLMMCILVLMMIGVVVPTLCIIKPGWRTHGYVLIRTNTARAVVAVFHQGLLSLKPKYT